MNWQTITAIASLCALGCGALGFFWKKVLPAIRTGSRIADKVTGVPANPKTGQEAVPGLFERLDHQDTVLETIRHEVEYNNGTSIKDSQRRTETELAAQSEQLKLLTTQLDAHIAITAASSAANTTINVNGSPT